MDSKLPTKHSTIYKKEREKISYWKATDKYAQDADYREAIDYLSSIIDETELVIKISDNVDHSMKTRHIKECMRVKKEKEVDNIIFKTLLKQSKKRPFDFYVGVIYAAILAILFIYLKY